MSEMSDPTERLLFDEDFAPAKATEPSKRWRNKWYFRIAKHQPDGHIINPGLAWSQEVWPSKDVAEATAQRFIQGHEADVIYLGAYPVEGDAP